MDPVILAKASCRESPFSLKPTPGLLCMIRVMKHALLIVGLSTVVLAGCVSHEQTIYRDEGRVSVEFENDKAARIFYEKFSKLKNNGGSRTESKTEVGIPFVFNNKERVVTGENTVFNRAVRHCDTNNDGKITEQEARIWAENR